MWVYPAPKRSGAWGKILTWRFFPPPFEPSWDPAAKPIRHGHIDGLRLVGRTGNGLAAIPRGHAGGFTHYTAPARLYHPRRIIVAGRAGRIRAGRRQRGIGSGAEAKGYEHIGWKEQGMWGGAIGVLGLPKPRNEAAAAVRAGGAVCRIRRVAGVENNSDSRRRWGEPG